MCIWLLLPSLLDQPKSTPKLNFFFASLLFLHIAVLYKLY